MGLFSKKKKTFSGVGSAVQSMLDGKPDNIISLAAINANIANKDINTAINDVLTTGQGLKLRNFIDYANKKGYNQLLGWTTTSLTGEVFSSSTDYTNYLHNVVYPDNITETVSNPEIVKNEIAYEDIVGDTTTKTINRTKRTTTTTVSDIKNITVVDYYQGSNTSIASARENLNNVDLSAYSNFINGKKSKFTGHFLIASGNTTDTITGFVEANMYRPEGGSDGETTWRYSGHEYTISFSKNTDKLSFPPALVATKEVLEKTNIPETYEPTPGTYATRYITGYDIFVREALIIAGSTRFNGFTTAYPSYLDPDSENGNCVWYEHTNPKTGSKSSGWAIYYGTTWHNIPESGNSLELGKPIEHYEQRPGDSNDYWWYQYYRDENIALMLDIRTFSAYDSAAGINRISAHGIWVIQFGHFPFGEHTTYSHYKYTPSANVKLNKSTSSSKKVLQATVAITETKTKTTSIADSNYRVTETWVNGVLISSEEKFIDTETTSTVEDLGTSSYERSQNYVYGSGNAVLDQILNNTRDFAESFCPMMPIKIFNNYASSATFGSLYDASRHLYRKLGTKGLSAWDKLVAQFRNAS